jgi:tetratricopeptide (TPR) repeat protein
MTRHLPCLLVVALFAFVSKAAGAQPASTDKVKAEAKSYVDAGLVAQKAGSYDLSITLYERAYALIPHPVLLFNMAQAHRLAGHEESALILYRKYLGINPRGSEAGIARELVRELEAHNMMDRRAAIAERSFTHGDPVKASATPAVVADPAIAARGSANNIDDNGRQFIWRIAVGEGWQDDGDRNSGLFSFSSSTLGGNARSTSLEVAVMLGTHKGDVLRFRTGGQMGFNLSSGGGSNARIVSIGLRSELDWGNLYGDRFVGSLVGPSDLGLFIKTGYGWGNSSIDGDATDHDVSGTAFTVGADLNLVNLSMPRNKIGIDFYVQRSVIRAGGFNYAIQSLGLMAAVRI